MSFIGPEGRRQLQTTAAFAASGVVLVVSICVGYFGGGWLDDKLGTAPYVRYAGLIFGIIAGFRNLFQLARTRARQDDEPNP
ncbi:MAG TPA: AtpZ/AtpI family protein [Polyangiales bacterium]|nr:AtpZ/AtpI family protein [Polyangiales bacterium]